MSALAEALVAAQRRAISAMEKWYVAGALDRDEATAVMESIGLTDACAEREAAEWDTDPREADEQAREAFSEGRSIYDPEAAR